MNSFKLLKKKALACLALFASVFFISCVSQSSFEREPKAILPKDSGKMKGVWVAAISGNYPRSKTCDSQKLKDDCDFIVGQCALLGFNAIFLQVRPSADALYDSKIFPWSAWLTGREGQAPNDGFDPLAYFCDAAHKKNIAVHAWINPYRIKAKKGQSLDDLLLARPALKALKDFILPSSDGNFYLDPGQPKVRDLIVSGVKEILQKYPVDGIHLDDYFYPISGIDDSASFKKYGQEMDLEDFRRQSVNLLVKDLYFLVKKEKPSALFGISPFGIWGNKGQKNPYGSATRGTQSYSAHFADSIYWIERGWLDYIAPQIYWERGHKAADYSELASWWNQAVEGSPVRLYVGIADYKAAAAKDNEASPWFGTAELEAQLKLNQTLKNVAGEIHFNFDSVMSPQIHSFYENLENNGVEGYN